MVSDVIIEKIATYSTDARRSNALLALLDYCGQTALMNVPENAALEFLARLERGEIKI